MQTDSVFDSKFISKVVGFIETCSSEDGQFHLTKNSDTSPFALCFAIFLYHLLGRLDKFRPEFPLLSAQIQRNLMLYKQERVKVADLQTDKAFLQLLSFSLSALYLMRGFDEYSLEAIISPLISLDIKKFLKRIKVLDGVPQSGNLAMCIAILLIYANEYLNINTEEKIAIWVDYHIKGMNKYGFWGGDQITHLQFQNGYHQYEILEYLDVENPLIENAVRLVRNLADRRGQFAPYFGGSGCYDYDAVSIITYPNYIITDSDKELLRLTYRTIVQEQNIDGGFSESQWIRPYRIKNLVEGLRHVARSQGSLRKERARYFAALMLPKHNRVRTHWTKYSRRWGESNLWDTWFRLLTLKRIECAISDSVCKNEGFINFPGIGFCSVNKYL